MSQSDWELTIALSLVQFVGGTACLLHKHIAQLGQAALKGTEAAACVLRDSSRHGRYRIGRTRAQRHWDLVRGHYWGHHEIKQHEIFRHLHEVRQQHEIKRDVLRGVAQEVRSLAGHEADAMQHYVNAFRRTVFCSHRRVEENFVKNNLDPYLEAPPPYPPDRGSMVSSSKLLYSLLLRRDERLRHVLCQSAGIALYVSAASCAKDRLPSSLT